MPLSDSGFSRVVSLPRVLENVRRFWYQKYISTDTGHLCEARCDVVLIGVTNGVEPVCPALREAAAIVEAEWIRLSRLGGPAEQPVGELPAARRCPRRTGTVVSTEPAGTGLSTRTRGHQARWPVSVVLARQRSPPLRA